MNKKWTMITVKYQRIPQETLYRAKINVDEVESEDTKSGPKTAETEVVRINKSAASMEEVIEQIHNLLQEHPFAKVTMVRPAVKSKFTDGKPRGFELDSRTVELIRKDLDAAKKMFAPIECTIQVRPESPRIETKEKDHG
jgi:uncharacterized protein YlxP (DUF503 family)